MSVLIKTMTDLPEHCYECPCHDGESGYCQADKEHRYSDYRPFWCPLVKDDVRNDAIKYFDVIYNISQTCGVSYDFIDEKIKEITMTLKTLPQEPCEDAISRQAAIDACLNGWNKDYKEIVKEIRALPSVNPAEKVGQWIEERTYMECPNCHDIWHYEENQTERFKYCPTCGQSKIHKSESEVQDADSN